MRGLGTIFSTAAWPTGALTLVVGSTLLVDYLLSNSPAAAAARSARMNQNGVRAAREIYIRSGCATVNGAPVPDLSYLPHHDCTCGREIAIARVAATHP